MAACHPRAQPPIGASAEPTPQVFEQYFEVTNDKLFAGLASLEAAGAREVQNHHMDRKLGLSVADAPWLRLLVRTDRRDGSSVAV